VIVGQISAFSDGDLEDKNSISCQRWSTSTIPARIKSGKLSKMGMTAAAEAIKQAMQVPESLLD
jgi:hypothetical protein